jgi:hypothetical protein
MARQSIIETERPEAAVVVRSIGARLARIEDLLTEMRHEQDVQLKRLARIQRQLDALTERGAADKGRARRTRQ